jgi:hypothetical protein
LPRRVRLGTDNGDSGDSIDPLIDGAADALVGVASAFAVGDTTQKQRGANDDTECKRRCGKPAHVQARRRKIEFILPLP